MEIKHNLSLNDLARELDIPLSVALAMGKSALLSQIGEMYGHPTTRCEDCRTAGQYSGDLESDLRNKVKRTGTTA